MFLNAENSLFYAFIYQIKYVNLKCVKLLFLHGMLGAGAVVLFRLYIELYF